MGETVSRILWRLSHADGHFSAATIARCVVVFVSKYNSNQPEDSPGRVIVFCLVLHRARVAAFHIAMKRVGSLSNHFNLTEGESR